MGDAVYHIYSPHTGNPGQPKYGHHQSPLPAMSEFHRVTYWVSVHEGLLTDADTTQRQLHHQGPHQHGGVGALWNSLQTAQHVRACPFQVAPVCHPGSWRMVSASSKQLVWSVSFLCSSAGFLLYLRDSPLSLLVFCFIILFYRGP